jgi:hypothetical protein
MMSRPDLALAALALLSLIACDTGSRIPGIGGSENSPVIRIANTTAGAIDLTVNGQVVGGSGHVNAGATSACISIDPAATSIGVREQGAISDVVDFAPALTPRAPYTVVAFASVLGSTRAVALPDQFTPTSGLAGLRILHVAPVLGALDAYVTPIGATLTVPSAAGISYGGNTGFFDVNPGPSQVRFTTTATSVLQFDAGTITPLPGQLYTMVLSSADDASAIPVATLVPSC